MPDGPEQPIYFDTSSVRGVAEHVQYLLDHRYKGRAAEIIALLTGGEADTGAAFARDGGAYAGANTMGGDGAEYYGTDIGIRQQENAELAVAWLTAFMDSVQALATAGAVAAETMTGSDADAAAGLENHFEGHHPARYNDPDIYMT